MTYYITTPPDDSGYLVHIGNKNSGRFPRGSGERPYQHGGGPSVRAVKGRMHDRRVGVMFERTEKNGKDKANISPAEAATKDAQKAVESASDLVRATEKLAKNGKSKTDSPAKRMSDEELRKAINRMELERRFDSLSSNDTYDGWEKTEDILSVVGGVVGILGGVAGAYAILKNV